MRALRITLVPLLAVTLSGCDGGAAPVLAIPTPTPPAATSPPWSDDEALTIATAVFERYLNISNQIYNEGGVSPERIDVITSDDIAAEERAGFNEVRLSQHAFIGQMRFRSAKLQQITAPLGDSTSTITTYMCVDLSETDVRDAAGNSVVSAERPSTRTWEVTIGHSTRPLQDEFIIVDKSVWKESPECDQDVPR